MQRQGRLEPRYNAGQVTVVPRGDIEGIRYDEMQAIGTVFHDNDTAVIIATRYWAILASIPSQSTNTPSEEIAAERNVRNVMREIDARFVHYSALTVDFRRARSTINRIICPLAASNLRWPRQVAIIESLIERLNLAPVVFPYYVPRLRGFAGAGTVFLSCDPNEIVPHIYLDDCHINPWPFTHPN